MPAAPARRSPALAVPLALACAVLLLGLCHFHQAFVASRGLSSSHRSGGAVRRAAAGSVIVELEQLAEAVGETGTKQLETRTEELFGQISAQELTDLQQRLQAAAPEAQGPLLLLTACIQKTMESRMTQAAADLDALLRSSGDIDANIRAVLEKQDSPLPILAVTQMNVARAQQEGKKDKAVALAFVFNRMNEFLEEEVPLVQRILKRLVSTEEEEARNTLLMSFFQVDGQVSRTRAEELGEALLNYVKQGSDPSVVSSRAEEVKRIAVCVELLLQEEDGAPFREKIEKVFDL